MNYQVDKQDHLTNPKNNQIGQKLNLGENIDIKQKIIIKTKSLAGYTEGMLNDIMKNLDQFLQSLNSFQNIPKDDLQKCKQLMDEIFKLINKAQEKIDSLEQKLSQEPYEDQSNLKMKKIDNSQTPQNFGDTEALSSENSSIIVNKQQRESEQKKVQQQNQINQIPNKQNQQQVCLINHSYVQDHLQDYQIILHWLFESNLKNNKNSIKCFCDVNIKYSHLTTLSNRNLFDLLLNQQQEMIFQNLHKKMKVLNCTNYFCSFRCINVEINNLDRRGQKYYCLLCDEYSVA